jgi:outer membrane protein assembly factor BamB
LILCCDGSDERFVVGLDKHTGKQIWRTERQLEPTKGFSFCTPAILNTGGRSQAICPGSGGVWSYDPKTGKQLWRVAYGEGFSVVPRPVIAHGLVYVCSGFGDGQLFAIDPTGSGDVTDSHVKWKRKKSVPNSPSLLVVGDTIYMVNDGGIASCVDAISGEIYWQERFQGAFSASPSFADGMIYFQNETGVTTVVRPDREYQQVARNKLGDGRSRTFASFAFVDSAILLRSETHLYRIQNPF